MRKCLLETPPAQVCNEPLRERIFPASNRWLRARNLRRDFLHPLRTVLQKCFAPFQIDPAKTKSVPLASVRQRGRRAHQAVVPLSQICWMLISLFCRGFSSSPSGPPFDLAVELNQLFYSRFEVLHRFRHGGYDAEGFGGWTTTCRVAVQGFR